MNTVNEKKLINIANKRIYLQFTNYLQQVINEWQIEKAADFKNAFKIYLEQNKDFINTFPNEYKVYNDFNIKCKFLTLNQFALSELVEFFKEHWIEQYEIPFYADRQSTIFFDLFDACMMGELIYEDRDEWKKKIIQSLKSNEQLLYTIQNRNIEKNTNNITNKITVGEFIVTFENYLGKQSLEFIIIINYLDKLQKEYNIDEQIKNKIVHLLKFYKVLVTTSMDADGAEEVMVYVDEQDHKFKVLKKGIIEEVKMDNLQKIEDVIQIISNIRKQDNIQANYDSLLHAYTLLHIDWKKVSQVSTKLNSIYKEIINFQKSFYQAINKKNQIDVLAHLLTLAHNGHLDEIFERDVKIKDIFKVHLTKKFSEKLAKHFEQNLKAPVYLSYFLQHVLKDILKLDENESAVLAIKLVNELKRAGDKQYLPIAYGDLKEGNFKWKAIIEKDDALELEGKND